MFVCDRPHTSHQILSPSALTTLTKGFIKFQTRKEKLYSAGLVGLGGLLACVCVWDLMSGKNKTQKTERECITTGVILVFGLKVHKPTLYTTHTEENLMTAVEFKRKATVFKKKPPCYCSRPHLDHI